MIYPIYYPIVYSNNTTQDCVLSHNEFVTLIGTVYLIEFPSKVYTVECEDSDTDFLKTYPYNDLSSPLKNKVDEFAREINNLRRKSRTKDRGY